MEVQYIGKGIILEARKREEIDPADSKNRTHKPKSQILVPRLFVQLGDTLAKQTGGKIRCSAVLQV